MNEFVDMHVHSKFSIDGMSTMEDYCLIAGKTGTRVICFTEHVDFNSAEKNLSIVKDNRKQNFVVDDYFREINRLRKKYGSLNGFHLRSIPEHPTCQATVAWCIFCINLFPSSCDLNEK